MKCDIAKKCGSCQFINQGYDKSLEYKNEECKKIFKDLKVNVHPVSGMEDPYYYRIRRLLPLIRHIIMVYMKRILIVLFHINHVSFMIWKQMQLLVK